MTMIPGTTLTTTLIRQAASKASPAATAFAQAMAAKSFSTEKTAPVINQAEIDRRNKEAERYYPAADDGRSQIKEIVAGYWTARGNADASAKVANAIAQLPAEKIQGDPVAKALKAEASRLELKPESDGRFKKANIAPYGEHLAKLLREKVLDDPTRYRVPGDVIQSIIKRVLWQPQDIQTKGRGRG